MHRIDTQGSIEGKFTDGDATRPEVQEATVIDSSWLNGIQETICKVIESKGGKLQKGNYDLLLKAIQAIVENSIAPIREDLLRLKEKIGL